MNKTTKLVAAGAVMAAAAVLAAPMAANAAPANGNPSNGNNANPSCAAFWAHLANYVGAPLGQVKGYIEWGTGQSWTDLAQTHLYDNNGYCGW